MLTRDAEIDHNFSKAHRIVTASILPVVEQYGENSKAIWEASKVRTTHVHNKLCARETKL